MSDLAAPSSPAELADVLSTQLDEQRDRVGLLRDTGSTDFALEESRLESNLAHEELRVAQDELRAQAQVIEELLGQQRHHGVWRERVSSLLPVPVFVTDSTGTVLGANSVASGLFGVPESGLLRRPLISLVAEADRRALRQVISQMAEHSERQLLVELRTRHSSPVQVTLAAFLDSAGTDPSRRYRWVAVPTSPLLADEAARDSDSCAAVFAKLCRLPIEDDDPHRLLGHVATLGRTAVPHADGISVSVGSPLEPHGIATESEFAQLVDGAQFEAGQGPCVQAYNTGEQILSEDVVDDPRWPHFAPRAQVVGLRGALAVPLQKGTTTIGVVNLYARTAHAFDTYDVNVAGFFAAAVGAVLQDVRERESLRELCHQLEEALRSRAEIDQAKGIIMARHGCTADEAFARLVTVSRNTNTKVNELASRLVTAATQSG